MPAVDMRAKHDLSHSASVLYTDCAGPCRWRQLVRNLVNYPQAALRPEIPMHPEPAPLHDVSAIETPEQIELVLPLAGVGSRGLAFLIDLLWQLLPIVAAFFLAYALGPAEARGNPFEKGDDGQYHLRLFPLVILNLLMFFVNFGYFALFEVFWRGQSPGKRALGLRVVRDGGYPIDGRSALLRNLLRVVDSLPGFYLVGIVVSFVGRGKRMGDYAAGTLVIRENKPGPARLVVAPRPHAGPLSAAEQSLIAQFIARRRELAPASRARVALQLANQLAQSLGKPAPVHAERFLEELMDDANR
jgi:uncharacterized RDD family membrane protein YckC